ncbi:DNA cytosine methyltransferase [Rhodopseudomonas palustris]|uniref:DNA (cytosine-5-)-methyltransferase n=1 Tax=Rhodopseudomonas palustris (strain DX-1) TaxID=652103 RepID=E6VEP8_RHOPX|nr:DNA cytosine methyltransferase [Rhodopseudomonas palustris]QDL96767.1 DNA cytosine methyltransferase [Rhodopseudomonas palustris]
MRVPKAIAAKVSRLASNPEARPRVLDLFSGCGGLSLGFHSAGYEIAASVEIDELAARSHAINFYKGQAPELIERQAVARDITKIDPDDLTSDLGLGPSKLAFDLIVGGPPCQAYARVGRAKLREVAEHPQAFKIDPRANLYLRYLHYVERLQPIALLMENVPDILNYGGHNIGQEIVEALDAMGYEARYSLLNSAHHGVPQMRDRVFLLAFHKSIEADIRFPKASRFCQLPSGYAGTRSVALKHINMFEGNAYVTPDTGSPELPPAVTAGEAIGDLPPITLHKEGKLKRGARRFTELSRYQEQASGELSEFAMEMRSWKGFESRDGVYDHVLRFLPRDTAIFEAMREGDEYPAAHRVAKKLFEEEAHRRKLKMGGAEWKRLQLAMVPPYDPSKFPNRWWKLRRNAPSRTLMAHLGKDTYSHIHYDSSQGRVITVREAARLQSFPDGFVFAGTMNPAFRQIGNAVPPVMARQLAMEMMKTLGEALSRFAAPMLAAE